MSRNVSIAAVNFAVRPVNDFGTRGQSALTYPDDTPDPSLAQAHLVHQVQSGRHVIVAPDPYRQGTVQPPAWLPEQALRYWQEPARPAIPIVRQR